ncbi:MAG: hypothetical protein V1758_07715 [Pseudomonadota bacterium]
MVVQLRFTFRDADILGLNLLVFSKFSGTAVMDYFTMGDDIGIVAHL